MITIQRITISRAMLNKCETSKTKAELEAELGSSQALDLTLERLVARKVLQLKYGKYCTKHIPKPVVVRYGTVPARNRKRILSLLDEPRTPQEVSKLAHSSMSPVRVALAELTELNLVRNVNGKFERI